MGNNSSRKIINHPDPGVNPCRAQMLGKSNFVLCHTATNFCHWHLPVEDEQFCMHPFNREIALGIPPGSWPNATANIC